MLGAGVGCNAGGAALRERELQLSRGKCELIRCITCTKHWSDSQLP